MVLLATTSLFLAFYGAGAIAWRLLMHGEGGLESSSGRILLTVMLGIGSLGQSLFVAGALFPLYRLWAIRGLVGVLALVGVLGIWRTRRLVRFPRNVSVVAAIALLLIVAAFVQWFVLLRGFLPGSDVFSHHYSHAKAMAQAGRFVHEVMLPTGTDMHSNYNPALPHVLYMVGRILLDERVANLFHWLSHILLVAAIYAAARALASWRAAILAVALYFGSSNLASFVPDVQDYTITAAFLVASLYALLEWRRSEDRGLLFAAAVLCGFAMSSKYYAFLFAPLFMVVAVWSAEQPLRRRLASALLFGGIAFAVVSPWLIYNVSHFGDPVYPALSAQPEAELVKVVERVHIIEPFVSASDTGFAIPSALYYASLFIPYHPDYQPFGLSVLYLLLVPSGLWFALTRPRETSSVLLAGAVAVFVALHFVFGRVAFFKWALFPAVLFAVAAAAMAEEWTVWSRRALFLLAMFVAGLNYYCIVMPQLKGITPAETQSKRWEDVTAYVNSHLARGSVVAGLDGPAAYYVRDDVAVVRGRDILAVDWPTEERLLRTLHVGYFVDRPTAAAVNQKLYRRWIDLWKQLAPSNPAADDLSRVAAAVARTEGGKQKFLERSGSLIAEVGSAKVYRLDWQRDSDDHRGARPFVAAAASVVRAR